MSRVLQVISHSEEETISLAEKLTATFRPGEIIILTGELGAGKTVFVKGIAKGLGHNPDIVNSPSYTLVNEYPGEKPLYHFDLYRMGDSSELVEIGWDDYLSRDGLIIVEWGEKAVDYLPAQYYQIQFTKLDGEQREIEISVQSNE